MSTPMNTKTRVSVTMTQPYLEDLDRRVNAGIYLNRGQAILAALRRVYGVEDLEEKPRLRPPLLEAVKDFVLSRRSDIEQDMENFGILAPVLDHFLAESEG